MAYIEIIQKVALRCCIIAGLIGVGARAHAFSPADEVAFTRVVFSINNAGFDTCRVEYEVTTLNRAYVILRDRVGHALFPEGAWFKGGRRGNPLDTGRRPITIADIAACLETPEANVSNLMVDGANGTFAKDTFIGFSFELTTAAGGLSAGSHEYAVTGTAVNVAPTADAGPDQLIVVPATIITLDGSGSSDPDDGIATYTWTQTSGPLADLSSSSSSQPTFTSPTVTAGDPAVVYVFDLIVTDSCGATSSVDSVAITVTYNDVTRPVPTLSDAPAAIEDTTPITVTLNFDESVNGFENDPSDVNVTNGVVTEITGSGSGPYIVTITPTGSGDLTVTVLENVATDDAGNDNVAAISPIIITYTNSPDTPVDVLPRDTDQISPHTTEEIMNATVARSRAVLAHHPNLIPLLADREPPSFNAMATGDSGFLSFIYGSLWGSLDFSSTELETMESSTVYAVIGGHIHTSPNMLVGAILEFDIIESVDGDFSQTSNGILAGPYFVASNETQTLFYDGSLLAGFANNEISPTGEFTDEYITKRLLATFKVSGNLARENFTLRPNVDLKYTSERNDGFTDSANTEIAASGVNIVEASVGFDAIIPMNVETGSLKLLLGASGIFASEEFTGAARAIRENTEAGRGRIDLGLEWTGDAGGIVSAGMFYDGLGANSYSNVGLRVEYEITF